jgi:signal peptidase II
MSQISRRPLRSFYVAAVVWLIADLLSKEWALLYLRQHGDIRVIPGFFHLQFSANPGAAFGLFHQIPALLPVLTLVILALMAWLARSLEWHRPAINLSAGIVLGGALGNFLDRLRHGAVVDFLDFHWRTWHYPTFNIADTGICVGLAVILWLEMQRPEPAP